MSISLDFPAVLYVAVLLGGFVALWALKRAEQRRSTGVDPLVMSNSKDPLQLYFFRMTVALEVAAVVLIVSHASGLGGTWGFERLAVLSRPGVDEAGLVLGLLGLALCRVAQSTMGNSWRVGIDEEMPTILVDTGVFRYIRNPTYMGLFTMILGLWLIWPTAFITMIGLLFVVMLEMQVRSEERFLLDQHGERYAVYLSQTTRYVPWLY